MKNIANYLDEFIDEENGIYECTKHNITDMKERMKSFKHGSKEEFKDKNKYTRKDKHKKQI